MSFQNIIEKLSDIKVDLIIKRYLRYPEISHQKIQLQFLARQLNRAKNNVPYYNKLLAGLTITPENSIVTLKTLPIVDKHYIRKNFQDFTATFVDQNWKSWHNTGGSTGEPFRFPIGGNNHFDLNGEKFCQALLYKKMIGTYKCNISSVDGRRVSLEDQNNNIYWGKNQYSFPYGKNHYSTMYLNSDTFKYYIENLNKEQPEILRGYPSGINELARLIKATETKIKFKLKAIYLTSENILDEQITLIHEVFNCPIWGQYGHSEASIFAIRYPEEKRYHCLPIYGYTEIINPDGSHVKEGEIGEIVVTGFQNSALPFIRYRTGDLGEYGGTKNGVVFINKLMGRSNDFIINKNNEKIYLVGFIFGGHLNVFNCVDTWQMTQKEIGAISIRIVKGTDYTKDVEMELINFFEKHNFTIDIQYVDYIKKTPRGKQPFLIQELK